LSTLQLTGLTAPQAGLVGP